MKGLMADRHRFSYYSRVRLLDVQQIGPELALKWDDGREDFIPLERLRKRCPCAGCNGEMDMLGNVYKVPARPLCLHAFEIRSIRAVGGYALQPTWGDMHSTGLYSFDYLRRVAEATDESR